MKYEIHLSSRMLADEDEDEAKTSCKVYDTKTKKEKKWKKQQKTYNEYIWWEKLK